MAKLDFGIYPKPVREKLLGLRQMIFDVAKTTPGVGQARGSPALGAAQLYHAGNRQRQHHPD